MVKAKRKQLSAVVKSSTSSQDAVDSNLSGEDSWVVVKKQRVNILIPRLSGVEQSIMPDSGQGQLEDDLPCTIPQLPTENPHQDCAVGLNKNPHEACLVSTNDGSMSSAQKTNTQSPQKVNPLPDNFMKPRKLDSGKLKNEDQVNALSALHRKDIRVTKFHKTPTVHTPFRRFQHLGLAGLHDLSSASVLNRMMRASSLERKIVRAGGLSRWLSSLGLEQFVTIFSRKHVTKFQLANLSMKKLKDMGAHAVGPRRKLLHAIECLSEPCCFKAL